MKLSVAKNENAELKAKVEAVRRAKLLDMQIHNDMVRKMYVVWKAWLDCVVAVSQYYTSPVIYNDFQIKESQEFKRVIKAAQKEMVNLNEQKHKAVVAILGLKNKMIEDMHHFSDELHAAKRSLSSAQTHFMETIRAKLKSQPDLNAATGHGGSASLSERDGAASGENSVFQAQHDIEMLLKEVDLASVEELVSALETSEEQVFALYSETQEKNNEVEKIEAECNHLEEQVHTQVISELILLDVSVV
jgi:hypothetical protein